jgi:PHD/YefM family antitoxin component YafN of YafNO toxin-antitoxin module
VVLPVEVMAMAKTIELKESQALYSVSLDKTESIKEPIILERDGKPFAALVSISTYEQFVAWQQREAAKAHLEEQHRILAKERAAFEQMKPELLKTHRNKWIAVLDGQLVDSDDDDRALTKRVYARHGYRTMLITQVRDQPRVWEFSSPEMVR